MGSELSSRLTMPGAGNDRSIMALQLEDMGRQRVVRRSSQSQKKKTSDIRIKRSILKFVSLSDIRRLRLAALTSYVSTGPCHSTCKLSAPPPQFKIRNL